MKFLFRMDPLETVDVRKDTSFVFMLGAAARGHQVFYLPAGGTSLVEGRVVFDVVPVVPQRDPQQPFVRSPGVRLTEDQIDAVFVRTDPPFNERYLMDTWLLDRLAERIPVVNSPHGLRTVNEKLWATRFTDVVPPTLVTSRRDLFDAFVAEHRQAVVKPPDGHGGVGVFFIREGDTNARVIFEMLTAHGEREVIVQPFVQDADRGDKRILLLGGQIIGAVLRVHGADDHRNNFFAGGKPHPAEITERDRYICQVLRPHLIDLGLHFTGIDVIGDFLIEVNVTSPTCVQEVNRLYDQQLEDQVIAYVEELVHKARATPAVTR